MLQTGSVGLCCPFMEEAFCSLSQRRGRIYGCRGLLVTWRNRPSIFTPTMYHHKTAFGRQTKTLCAVAKILGRKCLCWDLHSPFRNLIHSEYLLGQKQLLLQLILMSHLYLTVPEWEFSVDPWMRLVSRANFWFALDFRWTRSGTDIPPVLPGKISGSGPPAGTKVTFLLPIPSLLKDPCLCQPQPCRALLCIMYVHTDTVYL